MNEIKEAPNRETVSVTYTYSDYVNMSHNHINYKKRPGIYKYVKRTMDFLLASVALIILLPILILIAIIIVIDDPKGKPVFRQVRIGYQGKPFNIFKFRTMFAYVPANLPTKSIDNSDMLVTRVGKALRKYSLDELPQLINVVLGSMSLVGPRPLIPEEVEMHEVRRKGGAYSVLPGMTGLSQISGRDKILDDNKAYLDNLYARNVNFRQDFKILLATIPKVLCADGSYDIRK
ncbi:MAG: sugar transferase [Saccharofermentanales bacterium]|jgi:O-antigen biosynthesis protein WbqP|nr:sugar transferase [Bacillota bacterium]